jgi:hypothetical protein
MFLGLVSCSDIRLKNKSDKLLANNQKGSFWYCSDKRGYAGNPPNMTVVSVMKPGNKNCSSLISSRINSFPEKEKFVADLKEVKDPYDLAKKIKINTGIVPTIHTVVDYDKVKKTRVKFPLYNGSDIFTQIDFVSGESYSFYKKSNCMFRVEPAYTDRNTEGSPFEIILCDYPNDTLVIYGKLVARKINLTNSR